MQAARARPAASGCEVLEGLGAPARGDVSRGYDCSVNGRMARWLAEAGPASQSCTRGRGGGGRTATAAALVLSVLYAGLSGYADAQLEPAGRLQGKIAVAEFSPGITPGQISGTIEFRQCQQGAGIDGVFVKVNLDDSGQKCGPTGPCRLMYQINNVRVDLDVMDPNNPLAICGTVDQVFDPVNSRAKGWSNQNEDICSSTQNSSLGKDSKLQSCPVGGLSRKWGVLSAFFDENLAAFNNIIGLSVIVYNISSKGVPVVKGCAPIRFLENCNLEEKGALLVFKNSLGSGAELLPSWVQDYDMCQDFVGIRCDGRGHVQAILLDDVGVLVEEALELFADMKPISKANGTVTFVPTMTQNSLKLRMHGTLPDSFSQLREVRVLKMGSHFLYGKLPRSWSSLSGLRTLELNRNNITGTLPSSWMSLSEIVNLDLSDNRITGQLPVEWSRMLALEVLHLSGNQLSGTVPQQWRNITGLWSLNISANSRGLCDSGNILNATDMVDKDDCLDSPPFSLTPDSTNSSISGGSDDGQEEDVVLVQKENPQKRTVILIISFTALLGLLALVALVVVVRRASRSSTLSKEVSEDGQPQASAGGGGDNVLKEGSPLQSCSETSAVSVHTAAHDVVGAKTASAAAQYISPFANYTSQEALCKSGNNTAVGKDFRTESLNSRGSVSTESHTSTKSLHCPSGRHPLDFACIGEVEGANVDKDNILGSGGYGVVYLGTLKRDEKVLDVAVKVISNSDNDEVHMYKYKSFVDEVSTLSLFQGNDCIVKIYDYVLDYPRAIVFYEYLANDTLARLVHRRMKMLNYLEILQMGYGIAEGLAILHAKNVIHRDLKPDNILLDSHMRPKLTDFGISRQKDPHASSITTHNIGTWIYMAPEQFNGRLSEKSDIYSLGMVLWECWCNERPWSAAGQENQIWQVMYRLIHQSERPEIPDNCPSDLADIICSCWRTDPKARPSAVDVKNCLWGIIITEMNKLNEGPKRITTPSRQKRPISREGSVSCLGHSSQSKAPSSTGSAEVEAMLSFDIEPDVGPPVSSTEQIRQATDASHE